VFAAARGHGATPLGDEPVTYDVLARDLAALADAHGATRALGVSMGAGALLSLLAADPGRFERVVLFLPAALDAPRGDAAARRTAALAAALERRDREAVAACVAAELPGDLGAPAAAYVRARTSFLLASPGVAAVLRALPAQAPVPDRTALSAVTAQVLVLAQEGDDLHPAQLSRELAGVLPHARLVVFDRPGAVFRERARLRDEVVGFLDGPDPTAPTAGAVGRDG